VRLIDARRMRAAGRFPALADALAAGHRRPCSREDILMTQPGAGGAEDSLLVRAAWQPGAALGAKLATIFPANAGGDLPSVQAVYVLFDGADGRPLAVLDGTELTYWKTAADSALGLRLVGPPAPRTLLMVGAGALAPHLIRAHCAIARSIRQVRVWNRTAAKARALAAALDLPGVEVEAIEDLEAGVREADVISCATMARAPLVRGAWLRPGQHLDLVGGFTPEMREADDRAITRARLFVDARATTLEACGDLAAPLAAGVITAADVEADLGDLCTAGLSPPRADDDITVYKNGGGGHLDLMTARYFVDNVGTIGV